MFSSPYLLAFIVKPFSTICIRLLQYLNNHALGLYDVCDRKYYTLMSILLIAWILTRGLPSYCLPHRLPRGGWLPPPGFSVWFKILYRVIQRLIQHCFLSTMV